MMVMIWQKGWERERERTPKRETNLAKGGKRERKNEGPIWCLLVMVTTGVVVVACGGAMKGQWEERALDKRKKNEEGEETEKRMSWRERRYVMRQVIRVGPILCLILQMVICGTHSVWMIDHAIQTCSQYLINQLHLPLGLLRVHLGITHLIETEIFLLKVL